MAGAWGGGTSRPFSKARWRPSSSGHPPVGKALGAYATPSQNPYRLYFLLYSEINPFLNLFFYFFFKTDGILYKLFLVFGSGDPRRRRRVITKKEASIQRIA